MFFDDGKLVCGSFLEVNKVFDTIGHGFSARQVILFYSN